MKILRANKPQAAIPLCSTADIAFLLLIFFIVLSKNANESAVEWTPAVSVRQLMESEGSVVSVIIDKDNNLFVNGHQTSPNDLKFNMQSYLGDRPPGKRKVLLKVHKDVPERIYMQAIFDIGEVGGDLFRILDPEKQK